MLNTISENSDFCPIVPSSKDELIEFLNSKISNVIITTIQKIEPNDLADMPLLFIAYNLHSGVEKLFSYPSIGTYILFANVLSPKSIEVYGDVVGMYNLQQAILDEVLKPFKIEIFKSPLEQAGSCKQIDEEILELGGDFGRINRSLSFLKACALEIIQHFEVKKVRSHGKAVIIVRDLEAADLLLKCILELKPDWREVDIRNEVISSISSRNSFDERNFILRRFQDKESSLSLLIGTGSYLVSYDNPNINTIYVTCTISNQLQHRLSGLASRYKEGESESTIVDLIGLDWLIE